MKDLFCHYMHSCHLSSLERAVNEHFSNHSCRHFIAILQSSGYGKTKQCIELLKKYKGIYLLCGDIDGVHAWKPGRFMTTFLAEINSCPGSDRMLFRYIIQKFVSKIYRYMSDLEGIQFESQFNSISGEMNPRFFDGLIGTDPMGTGSSPSKDEFIKSISSDHLNDLERRVDSPQPILIIFDEAHVINSDVLTWLKYSLDEFNVLGIFLSTCSKLEQMIPHKHSDRCRGLVEHQPVYLFHTFDLFEGSIFFLGRPLWKHQFQQRSASMIELVSYCAQRLTQYSPTLNLSSSLALFMCRFGGLSPVGHISGSNFVHKHLATYCHMSVDVDMVGHDGFSHRTINSIVHYPSEPILAEASAYRTSSMWLGNEHSRIVEVLTSIVPEVTAPNIVSIDKGKIGEIVVMAALGYTMDLIRDKQMRTSRYDPSDIATSFSCPVPLPVFLFSLSPSCWTLLPEENKALFNNYLVNFTHFTIIDCPLIYRISKGLLTRHVAIICREYCPGYDLAVPAYDKDHPDEVVNIYISVKNFSIDITPSRSRDFLNQMRQPLDKIHPCFNNCISLLINTGSGCLTPSAQIQQNPLTRSRRNADAFQWQVALNLTNENCFVDLPQDVRKLLCQMASSSSASQKGISPDYCQFHGKYVADLFADKVD